MPNAVRRFQAAYLLELRLTCLHWSFLLFIALCSGVIITTYTQNDFSSIRGLFNMVLGFGGLIAMFLIGIHASRAARSHFDKIEIALPIGVEMLFARWLAGITALGLLVIAPIIVVIIAPAGSLTTSYIARQLLFLALSFGFITAALMTIQQRFGVRRWMYPLFAVVWVGAGVAPAVISNNGLPLPGINLVNFVTMNQSVSPLVWGQIPQGQLPDLTALFYLGLTLLLLSLSAWGILITRFRHRSLGVALAIIAAAGIVIFATMHYTVQVHNANQQVTAQDSHLLANIDQVILPAAMPFRVDAYDVSFSLGDPSQFTAKMTVLNRSGSPLTELAFSLYHEFQIVDASLPFTREHDTLVFSLQAPLAANDTALLNVTYAGNITYLEWRLARSPEATYFVRANGVYLPCAVLWYPVPGRILPNFTQYVEGLAARPTCLLSDPAAFRLSVNAPGTLSYASNLTPLTATTFASDGTLWAQLIGVNNLKTTVDRDLTLITTADDADVIRPKIEQYLVPAYAYLRGFFPDLPPLTVTVLSLASDSSTQWNVHTATNESLYLHISPPALNFFSTSAQNVYYELGAPLIKGLFNGHESTLTENIAYFIWAHYLANGDVDAMRPLLETGLPAGSSAYYFSEPFNERYRLANVLYATYVERGEAKVKALLKAMKAQIDVLSSLSAEAVEAWIKEAVNAD
jgi:hypothetical protein